MVQKPSQQYYSKLIWAKIEREKFIQKHPFCSSGSKWNMSVAFAWIECWIVLLEIQFKFDWLTISTFQLKYLGVSRLPQELTETAPKISFCLSPFTIEMIIKAKSNLKIIPECSSFLVHWRQMLLKISFCSSGLMSCKAKG